MTNIEKFNIINQSLQEAVIPKNIPSKLGLGRRLRHLAIKSRAWYRGKSGLDSGTRLVMQPYSKLASIAKRIEENPRQFREIINSIDDPITKHLAMNITKNTDPVNIKASASKLKLMAINQIKKIKNAAMERQRMANKLVIGAGVVPPIAATGVGIGVAKHYDKKAEKRYKQDPSPQTIYKKLQDIERYQKQHQKVKNDKH